MEQTFGDWVELPIVEQHGRGAAALDLEIDDRVRAMAQRRAQIPRLDDDRHRFAERMPVDDAGDLAFAAQALDGFGADRLARLRGQLDLFHVLPLRDLGERCSPYYDYYLTVTGSACVAGSLTDIESNRVEPRWLCANSPSCSSKISEIERLVLMRLMASASIEATESTLIFSPRISFGTGMVFVTMTSAMGESTNFFAASPAKMPCVAHVVTETAPRSRSASAAFTRVPPVEIMSSMMIAVLPLRSPTTSLTSLTSGRGRRLKTMATVACSRFANASARATPPASGETTTYPDPTIF